MRFSFQVKTWFQNRRMKHKKMQKKGDGDNDTGNDDSNLSDDCYGDNEDDLPIDGACSSVENINNARHSGNINNASHSAYLHATSSEHYCVSDNEADEEIDVVDTDDDDSPKRDKHLSDQ